MRKLKHTRFIPNCIYLHSLRVVNFSEIFSSFADTVFFFFWFPLLSVCLSICLVHTMDLCTAIRTTMTTTTLDVVVALVHPLIAASYSHVDHLHEVAFFMEV